MHTQSNPLNFGHSGTHGSEPDIPTVDWEPNEETIAAIREADKLSKDPNRRGFRSAEEAFAAILAEDDEDEGDPPAVPG